MVGLGSLGLLQNHLWGSINGATPSYHPCYFRMFLFTKTIQLAWGIPMTMETPTCTWNNPRNQDDPPCSCWDVTLKLRAVWMAGVEKNTKKSSSSWDNEDQPWLTIRFEVGASQEFQEPTEKSYRWKNFEQLAKDSGWPFKNALTFQLRNRRSAMSTFSLASTAARFPHQNGTMLRHVQTKLFNKWCFP